MEHFSGKLAACPETAANSSAPVTIFLNPAGSERAQANMSSVIPGTSTKEAKSSNANLIKELFTFAFDSPSSFSTFFNTLNTIGEKECLFLTLEQSE